MIFSDEAHFHLCGGVNRQDWIMWADENPHWFDERRLHPEKLTVWMGVGVEGVVGPYFWVPRATERGIDSSWMMSLLVDQVIPELQTWPNSEQLIFQQDGARPHSADMVLELLDNTFPNRWMANGTQEHPAPIAWPPRSPDLTPCDYFLWGWMKGRIFHRDQPPKTLDELRAAIEEFAEELRQDRAMRERMMANYAHRLRVCLEREGGQVEIR
jgi:signal transduction histidine kinase